MGITDPYPAFCLDQAVAFFGGHVQAELDAVKEKKESAAKAKRMRILQKYLGNDVESEGTVAPKKFADPAVMLKNRR